MHPECLSAWNRAGIPHRRTRRNYRRYLLQHKAKNLNAKSEEDLISQAPKGVNDGKGCIFVSHTGEVFPSGFLPLSAGNILWEPLAEIYQNAPLFRALRYRSKLKEMRPL